MLLIRKAHAANAALQDAARRGRSQIAAPWSRFRTCTCSDVLSGACLQGAAARLQPHSNRAHLRLRRCLCGLRLPSTTSCVLLHAASSLLRFAISQHRGVKRIVHTSALQIGFALSGFAIATGPTHPPCLN